MKLFLCFSTLVVLIGSVTAQDTSLRHWHLEHQPATGRYGISLREAYAEISKLRLVATPVTVAILDDGIDTSHEDLREALWVNKREIAGNRVDDDGNGYVDDLHGWNFLGNPDGRNVLSNSSEWIRVYWRFKEKYEGIKVDTNMLSALQRIEYAMWTKARSGVVGKGMSVTELNNLQTYLANVVYCDSVLSLQLGVPFFTVEQLKTYAPTAQHDKTVKEFMLEVFKQFTTPGITSHFVVEELEKYVTGEQRRASGDKVPPENNRRAITGDDEKDASTRVYGNADVSNGPLMHGSHLAGIIAANRDNGKGIQGIADNVKIMMVRTSAEGDEHDKDIAMGIRYAVDNGATIINMSFGKSLSPDKTMVDEAVRYALSKDVLLIQAAGNSNRNIDGLDNFPNPVFLGSDSAAPNWITVGASDTLGRPAGFSNYGARIVTVFAPGVAIYSTIPGGNQYMSWDGTSMAAPVVSGIAALLRSYFPALSAMDVRNILAQSVVKPGKPTATGTMKGGVVERSVEASCSSGGIVNAASAVQHAAKLLKTR